VSDTDWPAALRAALPALEAGGYLPAETRQDRGGEVRYGHKGSLSIRPNRGLWRDHEAGAGGGCLNLIEHVGAATDRRGALDWLEDRGLIERGTERSRNSRKQPARPVSRPRSAAPNSGQPGRPEQDLNADEHRRVEFARRLIEVSEPLPWPDDDSDTWADHPAFRWRGPGWPKASPPLAGVLMATGDLDDLRWLPADRLPRSAPGAGGALLTPRAPLAGSLVNDDTPDPVAVELEYVSATGGKVRDDGGLDKRSYGLMRSTVWTARTGPGRVHLAEGTADACAVAPHLPVGDLIAATGGTSGLKAAALAAAQAGRALVVHADKKGGQDAADEAVREHRAAAPPGIEARILTWTPDPDAERRHGESLNLPGWLVRWPEVAASVTAPAA